MYREWSNSINRNIVECKLKNTPFISQKDRVLIETLWNVNVH